MTLLSVKSTDILLKCKINCGHLHGARTAISATSAGKNLPIGKILPGFFESGSGSADRPTTRLRVARKGDSESTFLAPPAYAYCVTLVNSVVLVLQVAIAMTALYAFVHAAMQRPDAYTAADKMTKPVWLLILGASVPLTMMLSALGATIGACAAGVYLVDVRPKLLEIQGKSR